MAAVVEDPAVSFEELLGEVNTILADEVGNAKVVGPNDEGRYDDFEEIDPDIKALLSPIPLPIVEEDKAHRARAHEYGKELIRGWFSSPEYSPQIRAVIENNPQPTATTFNDLYKWTMMPVMRKMESYFNNNIVVTFGIDLREKETREALKTDRALQGAVVNSLVKLTTRKFDKTLFNAVLVGNRARLIDPATVESICGPDGAARTLAQHVNPGVAGSPAVFTVASYDELKNTKQYKAAHAAAQGGEVSLLFYINTGAVYSQSAIDKGEETTGAAFVEAIGPWHKVTWLETSMMQAVYQTILEKKTLVEPTKKTVPMSKLKWLAGALIRCAKGVAYSRLVQAAARPANRPTPALFTGRRTGSYLFMLLQNLFFAHHFDQFIPTLTGDVDTQSKKTCLGTSSCDSWYTLKQLGLPCLNPAGTHAHELSMVSSALFPDRDSIIPGISQVIGHYLYYKLVWSHQEAAPRGPMPMLPDTWGTRVFLHAADTLTLEDGNTLLSKITSARQDSGALIDFVSNLKDFNYHIDAHTLPNDKTTPGKTNGPPRGMMASEIDDTMTFLASSKFGYANGGIGGFFGDSTKVWGHPKYASGSMAIKAVEVRYRKPGQKMLPYIKQDGEFIVGYPVKIGDASDRSHPELKEGKLSLTRNLAADDIKRIKDYVSGIRIHAARSRDATATGSKQLSDYFNAEDGSIRLSSNAAKLVAAAFSGRNADVGPNARTLASNSVLGAIAGWARGGNRRQSRRRGQQKQRQSRRQRQQKQQRQSRRQRQQQRQRQTR